MTLAQQQPARHPAALAVEARVQVEQRLLAALFRWPTLVDLEPEHFLSVPLGALFWAMQDVQMTFPVEPLREPWRMRDYDDVQLALVVEFMRRELTFVDGQSALALFNQFGGLERYIVEELAPLVIMPSAIPDLVEQVRACPRCGR